MLFLQYVSSLACKDTKKMNTPDIIVLLLILIPGIWQGLKQGFIHQIVTIAALLLGVWIAYRFADGVGAQISQYVTLPENVVHILAFLLILILVYIVLALLGKILKKIAAATVGDVEQRSKVISVIVICIWKS